MKYVQPFDQPSNPTAPYVDLNAGTGTDGSIPPAKFFNATQAEILEVITHAGLTPTDSDLTQLRQAIQAMMPAPPAQVVHFGDDTGTPDNIVATVSPAITAYGAGKVYLVKIAFNNLTSTPHANLGFGSLLITRADGTACKPNDLIAGNFTFLADTGTSLQIMGLVTAFLPSSNIVAFPSSTTWTVPPGITTIKHVRVWGAGGGGGGSSGGGNSSTGGSGGGYSEKFGVPVVPGSSITITVGAGGAGGPSGANYGSAGGNSSFGSLSPVSASGGGGGSNDNLNIQGTPGSGSGGDLNLTGEPGGISFAVGGVPCGGFGGAAPFGGSKPNLNYNGPGGTGLFPGGGGNGGSGSSGGNAGGAGANGYVIIEY